MRSWFTAACALVLLAAAPLSALDISGFVYDVQGTPITGARIFAFRPESTDARIARWRSTAPERPALSSTTSDARGGFALTDLPSGVAEVQVRASGYAPSSRHFVQGDGALTFTLERAAEVQGRITAGGKPVAGATVAWLRGDEYELTAITSADGRYAVPDPKVWATNVAVFHPAFAPRYSPNERAMAGVDEITLDKRKTVRGLVLDAGGNVVIDAVIDVDRIPLGRSDEKGRFEIALAPDRFRRLTATSDRLKGIGEPLADGSFVIRMSESKAIEGTVRLRQGNSSVPLPGAPVLVREISGESEGVVVIADEKGRYALEGLPPGRYGIHLSGGLETRLRVDYRERMSLEDLGPNFVDVRTASRAAHDLDLYRPPTVIGKVIDRDGRPVAGAAVVLVAAGTPNVELAVERNGPRTASDGSFRIPITWVDGPQKLEVRVVRAGHSNARSSPFVLEGGGEIRADVVLPMETAVRLRVVNEQEVPIAGARTMFGAVERTTDYRSTPEQLLYLGQHGALATSTAGEVILGLEPGEYDFAAAAEGYQGRVLAGQTIGRASTTITITLPTAVTLSGKVVRNGRGVPQVHVHVANLMRDAPLMTDTEGAFTISGLAPGEYDLMFMKPDEMVEESLKVTAPAHSIRLELPPSGSLSGIVVDAETGQPIRQFAMEIQRAGGPRAGRPLHQMIRGADGRFEFPSVPAGEIELVAAAEGYLPNDPATIRVEAGSLKSNLRIALERGASIAGSVSDDRGRPLAEARVAVVPADPNRVENTMRMRMGPTAATTDASGEFTITGVRPGSAIVAVTRSGFLTARKEVSVERSIRVDFRLERGLSVTGIVRHGGRPVEGAQVGANTAAAGADYQTATTDSSGRFVLQGLLPAIYTISAFKEEFRHREIKNVDPQSSRELVIDLDGQERSVIVGRVSGMPRISPGEKVTAGRVSAIGTDHGGEAMIDPAGNFRIEDAPSGIVRVTAHVETSRGTRTTGEKVIEVEPGSEARVDLEFAAAVTVTGRITRAGSPAARATVVFMRSNGPSGSAIADEDGAYSVPLPERGVYRVFVHGIETDGGRYESIHTIDESRTLDIDLSDAEIRGMVVDAATGAPIAEAIVSVFPERTASSGSIPTLSMQATSATRILFTETMVDRAGRFIVKVPASGRYELIASARGYAQASRPVGGSAFASDQVFELSRADVLTVKVVDAQRGTTLDAQVIVRDAADRPLASRPERRPDGSVAFALSPGRYTVTAVVHGYAQRSVAATAPGAVEVGVGPGGDVLLESAQALQGRVIVRDRSGVAAMPCCDGGDWALTGTRTLIQGLMPGSYVAELIDLRGERIATVSFVARPYETVRVSVP